MATAEDTADEEDETFEVRITEVRITPDGNVDLAGSLTVTGTIEDDDPRAGAERGGRVGGRGRARAVRR